MISSRTTAMPSITARDRPRDEHRRIAARQQQRAAQVLLHHRPEDETQQQRRRLAFELDEDQPRKPKSGRHAARRRRCSAGCRRRCSRTAGSPGTAGDRAPCSSFTQMPISGRLRTTSIRLPIHMLTIRPQKSCGLARHHLRAGLDAVDGHRADHQRHHRVGRNAQRQQRNEGGLRAGVVGALRPRHAFDRALAEARRILGDLLFERVGGERRRAARRRRAGCPAPSRCRCRAASRAALP